MQERPILHPSAGAEIYLVLPEYLPAGRVRLLGGLPAGTSAAPAAVQIEAAEQATPLPLFGEMLLVILMLEIIREAGLRMPQTLGHSVSLIAALIIGDAAIAAGLMSTPVILTAAAASIAVFVTPSLYEVATVLRLVVLLAAGVAGRWDLPPAHWACYLG